MVSVCSNLSHGGLTPEGLRRLGQTKSEKQASTQPETFRIHPLAQRLGSEMVTRVVDRYRAGESATALAKEHEVAVSALLRLLRENDVVIRERGRSVEQDALLGQDYIAGATVAELEMKHGISHASVVRALKRAGVQARPTGRRPKRDI